MSRLHIHFNLCRQSKMRAPWLRKWSDLNRHRYKLLGLFLIEEESGSPIKPW